MTRRHVPAALAIVGILLVMSAAVLGMAGVLERTINSIARRLPRHQAALFAQLDQLWHWLEGYGVEIPETTLREYPIPSGCCATSGPSRARSVTC